VAYDVLFGPYLQGAKLIVVTDPYIRFFYQVRNFMELLETVAKHKAEEDEVAVHLVTGQDELNQAQQLDYFERIQMGSTPVGIQFTWAFDDTGHVRHIVTDTGWKILLDRGLDIFQRYEMNDAFDFANRLQDKRPCKAFEVTFLKVE
jgi:ATP-dependent Lon protease